MNRLHPFINLLICLLLVGNQLAGTHLHRHTGVHGHDTSTVQPDGHRHEAPHQMDVSVINDADAHSGPNAIHQDVTLDVFTDPASGMLVDLLPLVLLLAFTTLWPTNAARSPAPGYRSPPRPPAPGYRSPPRPPPVWALRPPLRGPPLIVVA